MAIKRENLWRASIAIGTALFLAGLPAGSTAKDAPLARLSPGDSVFWEEPAPVSGTGALIYSIEVLEPGGRLRVALDHSDFDNSWTIRVKGPGGEASAWAPYSAEAFIADAPPGVYAIEAVPGNASESVIRFRAKLEGPAKTLSGELLPNLRISPPYEFTFYAGPWYLLGIGDGGPMSCFAEEMAEAQVTRCLRFSFGPENAGRGPLELIYATPAREGGDLKMYQRVHAANGSTKEYEAGTYEYHAAHAHYHHPLIAGQQLFKVTDEDTGSLEEASTAKKTGFCMGDYLLVDWHRFYQAAANSVESSCSVANAPVTDMIMGLSTGWADIYYYGLEGNYMDFSDDSDGLYVVRAFTDQRGLIRETDETDNVSYAYIDVNGDEIMLLERGYGNDPWDPNKTVLSDPREFARP